MLSKYFLSLKTSSFLKSKSIIRRTTGFADSLRVGILFTYSDNHNFGLVKEVIEKLEIEGKKVDSISYIEKMEEADIHKFFFFNLSDKDFWGNWNKPDIKNFVEIPFDYLLNLDLNTNIATQNILAGSKAKCRVGRYEEGKSDYFEMMIDHKENDYAKYLDQVYHYIKKVRNGK
ncbi:MAG: hypothetical protein ACJA2S_002987 [Cyclobacteriaceae bacterium]|jgi:hypothetical protein